MARSATFRRPPLEWPQPQDSPFEHSQRKCRLAISSGVHPSLVFAFTSAPRSMQELHNSRLTGNDGGVQRGAAAPSRIAQNLVDQLDDIQRVVEKKVLRVAFHLVVAEIGVSIDVVSKIDRQLYGFETLCFAAAGKRAGRFALPIIESGSGDQRRDAQHIRHFRIGAVIGKQPHVRCVAVMRGNVERCRANIA